MKKDKFFNTKVRITGFVSIAIWSLLTWYYFNGGVPSHHILAREDLPEISNWWGAILLPILTWFVLLRIQKRDKLPKVNSNNFLQIPQKIWLSFMGALLLGISLSIFYTLGNEGMSGYLMLSVFLLSLFFSVYRAECLLGFVIGMTFTFGAILPTLIGSILAAIGFLIYNLIRPSLLFLYNYVRKK